MGNESWVAIHFCTPGVNPLPWCSSPNILQITLRSAYSLASCFTPRAIENESMLPPDRDGGSPYIVKLPDYILTTISWHPQVFCSGIWHSLPTLSKSIVMPMNTTKIRTRCSIDFSRICRSVKIMAISVHRSTNTDLIVKKNFLLYYCRSTNTIFARLCHAINRTYIPDNFHNPISFTLHWL